MKRDPNNKKPTKLLTAVTALLLAVGIVADVAMFGVFPSSLDKAFPGQNGDPELQKTSYANGLSVAQKVEEEGAVLLKNDGALPLAGTNRKINLLGYASANPVYGGTGSGGSSYTANRTDFVKAFTDAGFEVNQNLVNLYSPKTTKAEIHSLLIFPSRNCLQPRNWLRTWVWSTSILETAHLKQ